MQENEDWAVPYLKNTSHSGILGDGAIDTYSEITTTNLYQWEQFWLDRGVDPTLQCLSNFCAFQNAASSDLSLTLSVTRHQPFTIMLALEAFTGAPTPSVLRCTYSDYVSKLRRHADLIFGHLLASTMSSVPTAAANVLGLKIHHLQTQPFKVTIPLSYPMSVDLAYWVPPYDGATSL